ncbi:Alpha/Beta hydrolase protein [Chaetomidium leptoderma]|uniref:Alpha/Beta hydrolase protein n=1 Tax=Chaetomidium leptoderma TaxID=669021 RepID=A0AAN7A296_9PEZI|nr:Alpha/Beta hydrolase protein [Chaetomidium leptoderma]
MKGFLITCLSLASLALGAPSLRRQDGVTAQLLNKFKLYAQWSVAASCNNEKAAGEAVTCQPGQCSMFDSHNATVVASFIGTILDTRGFVAVDPVDQQIVVSFRGTTSVRNWIVDIFFLQIPCDLGAGCLAHSGFAASWVEVASRVLAAVNTAKAANPTYQIIVTGHSLGGSIATLATAYIRKAGHAADLYTYGAPRVGNAAFVQYVTDQPGGEYRITHTDDPVPRLPPIFANFRHTSPEYWVNEGSDGVVALNEVTYCPGYSNVDCNGGTTGLNADAHTWYFQKLDGCSTGGTPFKRAGVEMSDEELAAKLTMYAKLDAEVAKNLHAEGQS